MELATEIEITLCPEELHKLWGIFHHHITIPQLDPSEVAFRAQLLHLLDPMKERETKYASEVQARTGQVRR